MVVLPLPRPPGPLAAFRRDEGGGLIIFALFAFVVMLTITGLAVDLMRTETARTKLQTTLDRAVLAAADMDQTLDPEAVVRDYMAKAGLDPYLISVTVTDTATNRIVSAEANADVRMFFANLIGIDRLPTPTTATAAEAVSNLEVSLVLDVSYSMNGTKIAELQRAAISFANILLTTMGPERVKINIIPYSTQVSAPAGLLDRLGDRFTREHDDANCIAFTSAQYDDVSLLDPDAVYEHVELFDWNENWGPLRSASRRIWSCNPAAGAELVLFQNDMQDITNYVNALQVDGNTSIEMGIKWGAALLDPSMNTILNDYQTEIGATTHELATYDDQETDKVLIVMTDGQNTTDYRLFGLEPSGLSNIYYSDARNEFFVRAPDTHDTDGDGRWGSVDVWFSPNRRMNGTSNFWLRENQWPYGSGGNISDNVRQLTYGELFTRVSLYYNAYYHHYIQRYVYDDWWMWFRYILDNGDTGGGAKDARMRRICAAVRDQGVQVYAVGFEVTDHAATVMADCASSDSHFFRVAGDQLTTTFEQIARTITELRLTQ